MIFFIAINAVNLITGKNPPTGTQSGSDICLYSLAM